MLPTVHMGRLRGMLVSSPIVTDPAECTRRTDTLPTNLDWTGVMTLPTGPTTGVIPGLYMVRVVPGVARLNHHTAAHRVFVECANTGAFIPAGRLAQHAKACKWCHDKMTGADARTIAGVV